MFGPHDLRCIESLALLFSGMGGAGALALCVVSIFITSESSEEKSVGEDSMIDDCE